MLQIVKDHQYDYFGYVDKIIGCVFSSSFIIFYFSDPTSKNVRFSILKIRAKAHSWTWDHLQEIHQT